MALPTGMTLKEDAGKILSAKWGVKPSHYKKSRSGAGFESKVLRRLQNLEHWNDWEFMYNPWISFQTVNGKVEEHTGERKYRGCEPDILLFNHEEKILVIIECKMWQFVAGENDIRTLYKPVLQFMYPDYKIHGVVATTKSVNRKKNPINLVDLDQIIENDPIITIANLRYRSR